MSITNGNEQKKTSLIEEDYDMVNDYRDMSDADRQSMVLMTKYIEHRGLRGFVEMSAEEWAEVVCKYQPPRGFKPPLRMPPTISLP